MNRLTLILALLTAMNQAPRVASAAQPLHALDYDIVDQIGWRGDQAGAIPASVVETWRYDRAADTLAVTCTFNRKGFCPIAPMLALAAETGFPIEFDRKPEPRRSVSALGPLAGYSDSESYTYRIKGLGRYVAPQKPAMPLNVPPALRKEISAEVSKILEAGHLRPWLFLVNVPGSGADARGDVYWDNPGEVLYLLTEVAPLLDADMHDRLIGYLKTERAAFAPESLATVPYLAGTPREVNPQDAHLLTTWQNQYLGFRTKSPAGAWNLYGLARYYEATGEKPTPEVMARCTEIVKRQLEHRDWATLYWRRGHTPGFNAVHAVNQLFAGYVGFIHLARLAGDADAETLGWGLLGRTAALRFSMGKYTQFLHESHQFNVGYGVLPRTGEVKPQQFAIHVETDPAVYSIPSDPAWWMKTHAGVWIGELVSWNWRTPLDDVRQVERLDETGVDIWEWCGTDCAGTGQKREDPKAYWYKRLAPYLLPFRDMTPELSRFMADHLKAESQAFCRRVDENQPHWHMAYAEAILSAEQGYADPCDSYSMFLAHAWILGDDARLLEQRIDVPWLRRGDLYYLHKLAVTGARQ